MADHYISFYRCGVHVETQCRCIGEKRREVTEKPCPICTNKSAPKDAKEGSVAKCTWKDCDKAAAHQQKDDGGRVWADLCNQHDGEINAMLEARDAKGLLRAWVLASGGAAKMVRSM